MTNIFFTSDHHFGHLSIIKYTNRPFSSVEEMDEAMIQRWNEVVKDNDTVYHLGDFTLSDGVKFYKTYHRLNGLKFFLPGSHDHRWLKDYSPLRDGYNHILDPLYSLEIADVVGDAIYPLVFVLCHYSMRVWDRSHYGSFHLYGHSHGNLPGLGRSMDVGVDGHDFYPWSLEEVVERLSKIEPHNGVKNEQS